MVSKSRVIILIFPNPSICNTSRRAYCLFVVKRLGMAGKQNRVYYEKFALGSVSGNFRLPVRRSVLNNKISWRVFTLSEQRKMLKSRNFPVFIPAMLLTLFAATVSAAQNQIPLPQPKPKQDASSAKPLQLPALAPAPGTEDSAGASNFRLCLAGLAQQGVKFKPLEPFQNGKGCQISDPVKISAIKNDGSMIFLPAKPVLSCAFTQRLAIWLSDAAGPIVAGHVKSPLLAVTTGPGYVCRNRNGQKNGKLSEHAFGNAIDISGFKITRLKTIAVSAISSGPDQIKRMLTALRSTSCGYFTTVLGPGSNASHQKHLHLDYGKHGRTWNYRICE